MNAEQVRINELLGELAAIREISQHRFGQIRSLEERIRELEQENQRLKDIVYRNR